MTGHFTDSADSVGSGDADPRNAGPGGAGVMFAAFQDAWSVHQAVLRRYIERRLSLRQVPTGQLAADDVVQMTWLVLSPIRRWPTR